MTESPYKLTVRVVLKSATGAPPLSSGGFRWDRIVGAAVVASVLLGLSIFMSMSPDTKPVDAADQLVNVDDAAAELVASVGTAPGSAPESQPESKPGPDESVVQVESKPDPDESAVETEPRAESAEPPKTPTPGLAQASRPEPAVVDLAVAVVPEQLEPTAAIDSPVVTPVRPRQSTLPSAGSGEPGTSAVAGSSGLRSPPVTAISTRIMSPQVKRFLITDAVASREPVGDASAIREDRKVKGLVKVIAYSEVDGRAGDTLRYLWLRRDKVVASVPVRVGSDSWRSYTSKFLNKDMRGHWWVELQTSEGELLAVTEFEY